LGIVTMGWSVAMVLALEVVEAGAGEVPTRGRRQGTEVVQARAGRVEVHGALAHLGEPGCRHEPRESGVTAACIDTNVRVGEELIEVVGGVGRERIAGDHAHPETLEAPARWHDPRRRAR